MTLKDFMARFKSEKMAVEDPTDDMFFAALYQGLSHEGPIMKRLAKKQPSTLQGLMDKVEEFINQEETLKAMVSSRKPRRRSSRRLAKRSQSRSKSSKTTTSHLSMLGIRSPHGNKEDSEFHRPPKILGNPPPNNKDKYCDFHEVAGHHTEGCIALRLLIKKFIKMGRCSDSWGNKEINRGVIGCRTTRTTNPETTSLRTIKPVNINLETINLGTIAYLALLCMMTRDRTMPPG
jgi:hypothetical protein